MSLDNVDISKLKPVLIYRFYLNVPQVRDGECPKVFRALYTSSATF